MDIDLIIQAGLGALAVIATISGKRHVMLVRILIEAIEEYCEITDNKGMKTRAEVKAHKYNCHKQLDSAVASMGLKKGPTNTKSDL